MESNSGVRLGARAAKIFEALSALGPGWHSRKEIAGQLGKTGLQGYEVAALESLAEGGQIEAEQHHIDGPIPVRWEYKVK